MFLSFIVLLINGISAQKASLLLILPFDVVLCLAIYFLVTHAPQIWQKIMSTFDIDGNDGVINLAKGITVSYTHLDVYKRQKLIFLRDTLKLKILFLLLPMINKINL